ncbi:head-tail adaptor protein [Spirosoma fluminis]
MGQLVPRDRVEFYLPKKTANGSGGKTLDKTTKGELALSAMAEVEFLKPTREQLAEQTRLGQTVKVKLWARKNVTLTADHVLYVNNVPYALSGPPQGEGIARVVWVLYAKTLHS